MHDRTQTSQLAGQSRRQLRPRVKQGPVFFLDVVIELERQSVDARYTHFDQSPCGYMLQLQDIGCNQKCLLPYCRKFIRAGQGPSLRNQLFLRKPSTITVPTTISAPTN